MLTFVLLSVDNGERTGKCILPVEWMKLDNAAKIYPAITGSELTGVFRISDLSYITGYPACTGKSLGGGFSTLSVLQCRAVQGILLVLSRI